VCVRVSVHVCVHVCVYVCVYVCVCVCVCGGLNINTSRTVELSNCSFTESVNQPVIPEP